MVDPLGEDSCPSLPKIPQELDSRTSQERQKQFVKVDELLDKKGV
jgi:hypothetical protein